ncbi:hypothetical protein B0A55_05574 [Friedmanniomyces simplex]|uniref:Tryptophan synthase beta chain-like PALP domain-containing protein n=1 Tax=Friedmanniomyces simplex TaxID=329884 RepID=A0A4U0XEK1_9PEZI|nr:hypothetical protein B0A55_05574 [Friedmanniomyces simplex]
MSTYQAAHLETGEAVIRTAILLNPHHKPAGHGGQDVDPSVEVFHTQLPHYGSTTLHSLPSIAQELGFAHVFLKDESTRYGLSSFKILGASWAIHRALCQRLQLPQATTLEDVKHALSADKAAHVRLVTCTEGNWGRAVARMAEYYAIPATIYVPGFMNEYTRSLIRGEGADLRVLEDGSYDDTIAAVQHDAAKNPEALMVMDTSWPGYTEIPGWVTEGYSTLMSEVDRQILSQTDGETFPVLAVASVGVGSWAHSVVSHYHRPSSAGASSKIVTVEPTAAASFKESLHCGAITPIATGYTIMNGMNCGTTSTIAWPVLRDGVYAAVTVNDQESHECVQELQARNVNAGPCGAATLAALPKVCNEEMIGEDERKGMCVVLFSTEGRREYDVPT